MCPAIPHNLVGRIQERALTPQNTCVLPATALLSVLCIHPCTPDSAKVSQVGEGEFLSSRIELSSCSFRHGITTYTSTPVPNALLSPASLNTTSSPALVISNQTSISFLDDQRIVPVRDPQTKYFSIIHFEIPYIQPSSAKALKPVCLEALG